MKKVFYLTLFIVFMLFNINIVMAEACDSEDMARLKGLAAGVSYSSEYVGDKPNADSYQQYNVNFIGLTNEIYVGDSHRTFSVTSDSQTIKLESGINTLEIYSKNCYDLRLKSIKIELPRFNSYSASLECEGLENSDFEMCNPWYQGEVGDDFYEKVAEYKRKNNLSEDINDSDSGDSGIVNYIFNNKITVSIVFAFIILLAVIIILIRRKKNTLE